MTKKQKLELTWIGKDDVAKLEPRILIEDPELSYHASTRHADEDLFDNKLIFGDNLLALKALEQEYAGKVKCVFIDPPYNTGSAFEHYDDGVEHSLWLSLIRDRLQVLKLMLSENGSIWITIDDNEAHYLKILCDEIFGRVNFVASFVWQKTLTRRNDARLVSVAHDYVLVYAKNISSFKLNNVDSGEKQRSTYTNRDNDPRGDWLAVPFHAPNIRPNLTYPITTPSGKVLMPPAGRCWSTTKEKFEELRSDNRIYFGKDGNGMAQRKKFWNESEQGMIPWTWWPYDETGDNREANKEAKAIAEIANIETIFSTPKPEKLLKRILHIATNKGDIVLDSFAGSGTTGAVAQKMGRRWIMVELGEQCHSYIIPRLKVVIDGKDSGGVSQSVDWKGGGGFRYYKLAPSLLAKDKWDNWVINKDYDANMLAAAVCKHEGFTYSPSETEWWAHGYSTETDFIYVTTQTLTEEQLVALSEDVGNERTLLVCCSAFKASSTMLNNKLTNLTLKKMPHALLSKCEWGKDDYSLNISNLPVVERDDDTHEVAPKRKAAKKEADLFGEE